MDVGEHIVNTYMYIVYVQVSITSVSVKDVMDSLYMQEFRPLGCTVAHRAAT